MRKRFFGPSINALIEHEFDHQLEALVVYIGDLPTGRLFVPTSQNLALGDIVELSLTISGFQEHHALRGEVIDRTTRTGDKGVEILLYDMSPRRLAEFCTGSVTLRRNEPQQTHNRSLAGRMPRVFS